FHTRPVWAFHSVHHSSEEVNWLSAARFHPVENAVESLLEALIFLFLSQIGTDMQVLSLVGVLLGFYNMFIHAELPWSFGPLRYVFVSPVFHRWHHSNAPEAQDKNFAAMFSCLDLVLGTFYQPKDELPDTLGLVPAEQASYPRSLLRQILYPFRKH
ncbi:MAG TPA: sterol desaturase family protein, partial [Verrucomicrobiae bacterium]